MRKQTECAEIPKGKTQVLALLQAYYHIS